MSGSVESFEEQFTETVEEDLDLEVAVAKGLNRGLRDYFSSLLQVSNDHYNRTLQVYSMQIDERVLCCLIWFVGPLDVAYLRKISNILHILGARSSINWKSLLSRLGEGTAREVANMLLGYLGVAVEDIFNDVLEGLFEIPGDDWDVAIKNCVGIELLFNLIESAWLEIFFEINKLMKSLQSMIKDLQSKGNLSVEIAAERRWLVALAGLLRAVIDKIEGAQEACSFDLSSDPSQVNDLAAEAAVQFVVTELNTEVFPTISLSEDLRRKFFRNVPEFETSRLKLPIPGLDDTGHQQDLTAADKLFECGENGRAIRGLAIGQKIANMINA